MVAGTRDAILMVEGEANFISGDDLIEAIDLAHKSMMPLIEMQDQLREKMGKPKWTVNVAEVPADLKDEIRAAIVKDLTEALSMEKKLERGARLKGRLRPAPPELPPGGREGGEEGVRRDNERGHEEVPLRDREEDRW